VFKFISGFKGEVQKSTKMSYVKANMKSKLSCKNLYNLL